MIQPLVIQCHPDMVERMEMALGQRAAYSPKELERQRLAAIEEEKRRPAKERAAEELRLAKEAFHANPTVQFHRLFTMPSRTLSNTSIVREWWECDPLTPDEQFELSKMIPEAREIWYHAHGSKHVDWRSMLIRCEDGWFQYGHELFMLNSLDLDDAWKKRAATPYEIENLDAAFYVALEHLPEWTRSQ